MALYTKCILHEPEPEDGLRVSVMSRHTLDDGVTPDWRIRDYDIHVPSLGPSPRLIGSYKRKKIEWNEFARRYLEEIRMPKKHASVKTLARAASEYNITILCVEETADRCHRRLLAEECLRLMPGLMIAHR